jgi:two-component system, chemotaxis family, response regulator Rcp1
MDNLPAITLHCVRKNGRLETTNLTNHTLFLAREVAKRVLQAGNGLYTRVHVCTEDGHIETIDNNTELVGSLGAPEVLLVEDNAGEALLIGQALEEGQVGVHLHIARDGEQALRILSEPDFKLDLIILDLNIPRISGHTVLSLYHPKKTPVVVFTASENKADIDRAFSLGADEFVHKPMDLDVYKTTVRYMIQKWAPREESSTPVS